MAKVVVSYGLGVQRRASTRDGLEKEAKESPRRSDTYDNQMEKLFTELNFSLGLGLPPASTAPFREACPHTQQQHRCGSACLCRV